MGTTLDEGLETLFGEQMLGEGNQVCYLVNTGLIYLGFKLENQMGTRLGEWIKTQLSMDESYIKGENASVLANQVRIIDQFFNQMEAMLGNGLEGKLQMQNM